MGVSLYTPRTRPSAMLLLRYVGTLPKSFIFPWSTSGSIALSQLHPGGQVSIGRANDCAVCLHAPDLPAEYETSRTAVSRTHAFLSMENDGSLSIRDSTTLNGTFVDGLRVLKDVPTPVPLGCELVFGGNCAVPPGEPPSVYQRHGKVLLRTFAFRVERVDGAAGAADLAGTAPLPRGGGSGAAVATGALAEVMTGFAGGKRRQREGGADGGTLVGSSSSSPEAGRNAAATLLAGRKDAAAAAAAAAAVAAAAAPANPEGDGFGDGESEDGDEGADDEDGTEEEEEEEEEEEGEEAPLAAGAAADEEDDSPSSKRQRQGGGGGPDWAALRSLAARVDALQAQAAGIARDLAAILAGQQA
jgi:hypothetical protein